ncbi:hypothetical protein BS47DRAFT_1391958 [Hydnum rufescens UP504]|uniref:Uncharacterized protein n=1 Tax=Hydnum rufescens UP504 TaxID=1448309 RepID=A0A9P6B055_9AGAM|nr:hypothetical protein BS47DRAFT_1391958 [Hydnum rufescens UP504]
MAAPSFPDRNNPSNIDMELHPPDESNASPPQANPQASQVGPARSAKSTNGIAHQPYVKDQDARPRTPSPRHKQTRVNNGTQDSISEPFAMEEANAEYRHCAALINAIVTNLESAREQVTNLLETVGPLTVPPNYIDIDRITSVVDEISSLLGLSGPLPPLPTQDPEPCPDASATDELNLTKETCLVQVKTIQTLSGDDPSAPTWSIPVHSPEIPYSVSPANCPPAPTAATPMNLSLPKPTYALATKSNKLPNGPNNKLSKSKSDIPGGPSSRGNPHRLIIHIEPKIPIEIRPNGHADP